MSSHTLLLKKRNVTILFIFSLSIRGDMYPSDLWLPEVANPLKLIDIS